MKECQNYCEQGRRPCPCPQACEMPDDEADKHIAQVVWVIMLAVVFSLFVAFFWR